MAAFHVRRVALALVLVAPAGCALALGDPGGDVTPPSIDAGALPKDATTSADRMMAADVATRDARSDREGDAARDVGSRDSTTSDGSDGGLEARADASDAAEDHANDAHAEDVHAGDAADARVHDAAPGDAPLEGGFCRNYKAPLGAWVACDDFDEDTDPTALGTLTVYGPGTLEARSDASVSPPNSLFATTNPGTGTNAESGIGIIEALPARNSYTLDFYARITLPPGELPTQFTSITFSSGADVSLLLDTGNDGGLVTRVAVAIVYLGAGNVMEYTTSAVVDLPAVPANGWSHFVLSVMGGASAPMYSLVVNDVPLFGGPSILMGSGFFEGKAEVDVGWFYAEFNGARTAYVDNVVVTAQ